MRKFLLIAFLGMLCLGLGLALSCSSGDDDDDDSGGSDDDDTGSDDDDDSGDDDTSGDLTWQEPPSSDAMTWEEAIAYCDSLSFDGHDDWRLPTISELRSLITGCAATATGGACTVTDDCLDTTCLNDPCDGCAYQAGPGAGGAYWPPEMSGTDYYYWYWSSSAVADNAGNAWFVAFDYGYVRDFVNSGANRSARCVRP